MTIDPHSISNVNDAHIIDIPRHTSQNGSLSVLQNDGRTPLDIKRVFYVHDVPADSERGGHSHFETTEIVVAVTGSLEVELSDGVNVRRWRLDRPYKGLYVPAGLWIVIDRFSGGATYLVMTSTDYSAEDYVYDSERFRQLTRTKLEGSLKTTAK